MLIVQTRLFFPYSPSFQFTPNTKPSNLQTFKNSTALKTETYNTVLIMCQGIERMFEHCSHIKKFDIQIPCHGAKKSGKYCDKNSLNDPSKQLRTKDHSSPLICLNCYQKKEKEISGPFDCKIARITDKLNKLHQQVQAHIPESGKREKRHEIADLEERQETTLKTRQSEIAALKKYFKL